MCYFILGFILGCYLNNKANENIINNLIKHIKKDGKFVHNEIIYYCNKIEHIYSSDNNFNEDKNTIVDIPMLNEHSQK